MGLKVVQLGLRAWEVCPAFDQPASLTNNSVPLVSPHHGFSRQHDRRCHLRQPRDRKLLHVLLRLLHGHALLHHPGILQHRLGRSPDHHDRSRLIERCVLLLRCHRTGR